MRFIFIIILFASFVLPSTAQEDTDQATVRCYYRFIQKQKTGDIILQDTLTLDVGSRMSRYYDERKIRQDSVFQSIISNLSPDKITSISIIKDAESNLLDNSLGNTYRNNTYDGISEQIYKDRQNGKIIMLNTSGDLSSNWYKGIDSVGMLNWAITPDTAVFLNYPCQKATLQFRGRNYEAWFSPQIPINDGPWKFFGLPGLILKAKDTDGFFDFECVGLEYQNTPCIIEIQKQKYFECSRKNYNKVIKNKNSGQAININGGDVTIAGFKTDSSFQPMELE
ncbi:MAG: GLPGLI family protein [Candidatus Azobacteroides sp.]|nr:GLPGLI family protein [Candidatus Azobacteroides sp.]